MASLAAPESNSVLSAVLLADSFAQVIKCGIDTSLGRLIPVCNQLLGCAGLRPHHVGEAKSVATTCQCADDGLYA